MSLEKRNKINIAYTIRDIIIKIRDLRRTTIAIRLADHHISWKLTPHPLHYKSAVCVNYLRLGQQVLYVTIVCLDVIQLEYNNNITIFLRVTDLLWLHFWATGRLRKRPGFCVTGLLFFTSLMAAKQQVTVSAKANNPKDTVPVICKQREKHF